MTSCDLAFNISKIRISISVFVNIFIGFIQDNLLFF